MTAKQDATIAELQRANAELRREREAGLAREATLAEELAARDAALAQRNTQYSERIEQQAAIIDVLKVMSGSPGDPQPVFDLIVERARDLCEGYGATVLEFDGRLLLHRASTGIDDDPAIRDAIIASYPKAPVRSWPIDLAVLERRLIIVDDLEAEPNLDPALRNLTHKSVVSLPLIRGDVALGALALGGRERGGFSDSQIELLKTFAEQAVIAITSAETYSALQTRTSDLQETLEYQTATSDVLKVISRSTFDLQPVLAMVAKTAARLCAADQAALIRHENGIIEMAANSGFPPEYEARLKEIGPHRLVVDAPMVAYRAINERRVVHIHDVAAVRGYAVEPIKLGQQRTSLGVPLLRAGEPIGSILLARRRVEPFTDRQIELVNTFADQAVIAIENTRLLTEQREALEQQTATAEVLQIINTSPGELGPVFEAILERAHTLCGAPLGSLVLYDGKQLRAVATRGYPHEYEALARQGFSPIPPFRMLLSGEPFIHVDDTASRPAAPNEQDPMRRAAVEIAGVHTALFVPLRKDATVLGYISAQRQEIRPFNDKQIALLQNFAAQAVVAMENARLLTETREALEQQTATAEVLQVINASPGDLEPVFDAMLEKATRLCEAPRGQLAIFDGEYFRFVAVHGDTGYSGGQFAQGATRPEIGVTWPRIVAGEQVVHMVDVADTDLYRAGHEGARRFVDVGRGRTLLTVALRKDDVLLGSLTVYRQEVRPFTDKQIALLQNFAAQAVIAMENARLITETREALEQQTATAEVLQVINASPANLAPVFDAMLDKALGLCNAAFGVLWTYDGTRGHAVALRGVPPAFAEYLTRAPHTVDPGGALDRLLSGEPMIHIADAAEEQAYRSGNPLRRALVELGRARTLLAVPLHKDNVYLGHFVIYRREVRPFSDRQIALLQNFAAQAVIAMENARLLTEQQEALEQQTATAEVLQVINASPGNLAPVFDAMLQKATDLCAAAFGILWTFDGEDYHAIAFRNVPPAYAEFLRDPPAATPLTPLGRIAAGEAFAHIADIADAIYAAGGPLFYRAVELGGFRTMVGVALRKDAVLLGAITIYRQEVRPFSDKQVVLLQNFAAQAVVAIENARLLDEIRQRQEELRVTFENMGDGVAMFDETQHLVAWNRKFQDILDVPDDIIARRQTYSEYVRYLAERGEFGPDTEEQVRQFVEQAGQSRTYERTRPDGRVIEVRHNPVPDGGFVLIYADITERKRNEAEIRAARDAAQEASRTIEAAYRDLKAAQANLIQAEKMASLGQLTAGIAHEIKNPLNFVNNFAALSVDLLNELKETAAPGLAALSEQQRAEVEDVSTLLTSNLEKITEHGKRADGIVKAMLEHSRESSAERRMVDLNALIDEALNLAYHGARAQDQSFNTTLERDFGDGIAQIEVNPQDMTRVFLNLFSNGFYAATKRARNGEDARFEPTLKVTTRNTGDAVEIRVRDNGTGIQADIRDKLFQPFFTTKPTGEGTGLGLSITYDIVTKAHGGSIAVDSKVADYSEFTIRLPRNL